MSDNTREIVLELLLEAEKSGEYSSRLVKAALDKVNYLPGRDKSFIKRLAEGTTERQIELDYILNRYSSVPVRKMKPLIRCLMRMSVYQLLYMDTVPDSAVCNEAVKLAARRKFGNLKGFVNGVLRTISREKEHLVYPDARTEPVRSLSVRYSMPEWLVELWLGEYGEEITAKLLDELLKIHPVSIRFRAGLDKEARLEYIAQMEKLGVQVSSSPYLPAAYLLTGAEGIASLPGFAEGAFTVQDVSSMLAVEAAGIRSGDQVLDVCAAPGGKSLLACEKAAHVTARDLTQAKIVLLEENAKRMRAGNLEIEQWDAAVFDPDRKETADVLLLDVPCSGLGVMGKKRDIKYHASGEGIRELNKLQKEIVRACWQYVKPGGILLYSTCTISREENEDMAEWICREFPFEPDCPKDELPLALWEERERFRELIPRRQTDNAGGTKRPREAPDGAGKLQPLSEGPDDFGVIPSSRAALEDCCVQLLPGFMDSDGFFFARLRRRERDHE